jgi:recombinational DNA repair ATPase RecF
MLLDDVMSELDPARRQSLVEMLGEGGQALITTTEFEHVPGSGAERTVEVSEGIVALRDRGSGTIER